MTTLREWLNRLQQFDPDDWGKITQFQTEFSEEELSGELEAEIAWISLWTWTIPFFSSMSSPS
jgi:hypothetical protein